MVRIIPAPRVIPAAGYPPKQIAEYIGREISGTRGISVAMMKSPPGWTEPGQVPEFDEYSLVLSGSLVITTRTGEFTITNGQAAIAPAGEWVRYSSPDGAEYMAICMPAFSPDLVHRDDESPDTVKEDTVAKQVIYEEHGREGFGYIEDLWYQLREHHASHARFFSEQILERSFPDRRDEILKTNADRDLLIQIARSQSGIPVGFCICSVTQGECGEIESIYVEPGYRSRGIGTTFMNRAGSWMKENGAAGMEVGVCEGNEEALRFYEQSGYYLRRYHLIRK